MVPFFELCGGSFTGEGVLQFAKEVLESLDRKPVILKKPAPGFIGNRLQFALWREAMVNTVSLRDPQCDDEILTAWAMAIAPGLEYLRRQAELHYRA